MYKNYGDISFPFVQMKFTSFTKISMHLNLMPETNIEIPSVELSRNEPRSGQEVALVKKLVAFSIPSLLFARDALETSARSCPDNFFGIRLIFPPAEKHHGRTNIHVIPWPRFFLWPSESGVLVFHPATFLRAFRSARARGDRRSDR